MFIRPIHLLTILLCFVSLLTSYAQDSVYINIAPQWYKIYPELGSGRQERLLEGKQGNLYSCGYYTKSLKLGSYNFASEDGRSMLLIKQDSSGNIQWARTCISGKYGNSTGNVMAFDKEGNVILAGSFSQVQRFTSTDSQSVINLSSPAGLDIFIAKYTSNGKLIWVKNYGKETSESVSGMAVDKKGDIYLTGERSLKTEKPGVSNNAVFIAKLDGKGTLLWEKEYDSPANDQGTSVVIDSKNYPYFTGIFRGSMQIGKETLNINYENFYLLKLSPEGSQIWVTYAETGYPQLSAMSIDKKDMLYLAGSFGGSLKMAGQKVSKDSVRSRGGKTFLIKMDTERQVKWMRTSEGEHSHYVTQMKAADDGYIYLSSHGLSAWVFLPDSSKIGFPRSPLMGSVSFMVKYNEKGDAQWLRTIPGKGAKMVYDFTVDAKSTMTVTGYFDNEISFKNAVAKTTGHSVFYARTSSSSLNSTEPDLAMLAQQKEALRKVSLDTSSCTCQDYNSRKFGLGPLVTTLASYSEFKKVTGFVEADKQPFYNHLFFLDFQTDAGRRGESSFHSMKIVAYASLRFRPASDAVVIHLNPCEKQYEKFSLIPINISKSHSIKNINPEFDANEFKPLAKNYYDNMLSLTDYPDSELLEDANSADRLEEQGSLMEFLIDTYKLNLKPEDQSFESVAETLNKRNISVPDVIYNFYLKPLEGADGKVTPELEEKLNQILHNKFGSFKIKDLNEGFFYPKYSASIEADKIAIEFPENIVKSTSSKALFKVKNLKWTNKSGIEVEKVEQFCMPAFTIGNTPVQVHIKKALPDFSPFKNTLALYPGKYISPADIPSEFTGIYAYESEIIIPYHGETLKAKGYDIQISNKELTGFINLRLDGKKDFRVDEFIKYLTSLKFKSVIAKEAGDGEVVLSFKYLN